jgi:hypothetical protein
MAPSDEMMTDTQRSVLEYVQKHLLGKSPLAHGARSDETLQMELAPARPASI